MLQAVKGITTEANFLFKAALGIGFLIFSVKKAIDNQTSPVMEFGKLLLLGGVTWNLFLSSSNDDKHRFMVYDEVTSKSYVISQLPVGMGVSLALMSNFERVVLKSMEKHFSTPQSTNFSNAGLGFSLQVMST
ncbi:conjugal transfer protein TraG, partial [Campylobacter jejuni]|nr:conjugal transfer protein TraG [Campylobacter jejuni]